MSEDKIDPKAVVGHVFDPIDITFTERDTVLYALGVVESHGDFKTLPSMGVLFSIALLGQVNSIPALPFNPMMLLHGEQYLELKNPIPTSGALVTTGKVKHLYDKGKGGLLIVDAKTVDKNTGQEIVDNQISLFIRGIGGFGGDKAPAESPVLPPKRAPDAVISEKTSPQQALLYRLSGDLNPLHASPDMAAMGGFDRPILHGLCSFGFAARAVLHQFCDSDAARFKAIRARFVKHVFPETNMILKGDTIITEMWKVSPTRVIFQCRVQEREGLVLSNAYVDLFGADAKL